MSDNIIGGIATEQRFRRKPIEVMFDSSTIDLSGSLPTSHRSILGNYVQDKNNLPTLINRVSSGGATQVYNTGVVNMSVPIAAGSYAIAQSYQRHPYYAGVPQFIEMTFDNFQVQTGIVKEVGYFQGSQTAPHTANYNGIYLESDGVGNNINFCIAKNGTITRIAQSSWNIDRMNGSGIATNPSGITLDFSKFTVAVFEFLYLGGAGARLGFAINGRVYWVHSFNHVNTFTGTFIGSPVQPIRWSIRNVSGTGTGSMGQICGTVCALGSIASIGQYRAAFDTNGLLASRTAFINANSAGVTYMLRAIRINPVAVNTCIVGLQSVAFSSTSDDLWLSLHVDPTVTGLGVAPATWESLAGSNIQYAYGDTVTAGGAGSTTQLTAGGSNINTIPLSSIGRETDNLILDFTRRPGISIAGVSQTIVLAVTPTVNGTNADVFGSLNFIEV